VLIRDKLDKQVQSYVLATCGAKGAFITKVVFAAGEAIFRSTTRIALRRAN